MPHFSHHSCESKRSQSDSLNITAASDGEAAATESVAADQSAPTVTAKARATADITVTANDGEAGTVDDTFTVTVEAAPLVASTLSDISSLEAGATQDVSLSAVFIDANGNRLTITAASSDDAKATVTVAADQSKLTLAALAEGRAAVTLTPRDSDGNTVSDTFDVSVKQKQDPPSDGDMPNRPPTVVSSPIDISLGGRSRGKPPCSACSTTPTATS